MSSNHFQVICPLTLIPSNFSRNYLQLICPFYFQVICLRTVIPSNSSPKRGLRLYNETVLLLIAILHTQCPRRFFSLERCKLYAHQLRHGKIRQYTVMQYPSSKQIRQRTVIPSYWVTRWTNMRVPSLRDQKQKRPVPSRRKQKVPSCPFVKKQKNPLFSRLVYAPSSPVEQNKDTVPSHHDNLFTAVLCTVLFRHKKRLLYCCAVPSRRVISHPHNARSHPVYYNCHYFTAEDIKTVQSRPVSNIILRVLIASHKSLASKHSN